MVVEVVYQYHSGGGVVVQLLLMEQVEGAGCCGGSGV